MVDHFRRLRDNPGDDLLSQLVQVQDAEGGLTELELAGTAMLLLGAGFETTVNLIGNGTVQLLRHPEQLARLREDAELWPNAVEEILRYDSPVQRTARVAMADTEVAGQTVREGSLVACLLGGANRDPDVFSDPHAFDVGRPNARDHLAFSAGVHFCLGAALARMEGVIGLQALFDRFPDLALAGEPHRRGTRVLRGFDRIPVRLTGARAPLAA
jgi:cytochrome P450